MTQDQVPPADQTASFPRGEVLIPRAPDRAGEWVKTLHDAGYLPRLVPLIDFERGEDFPLLSRLPERLRDSEHAWMVITSVTSVRALKEAHALEPLALLGNRVKWAAVGSASTRALEAEGVRVRCAPKESMNAQALAALLVREEETSSQAPRAFLPQADIARSELAEFLQHNGWQIEVFEAYRTVDAPADPERRLSAALKMSLEQGSAEGRTETTESDVVALTSQILTPEQALGRGWAAVFATSPSVMKRLAELFGENLPPVVSIGPTTYRSALEALRAHGREEDLQARVIMAEQPTAESMLEALDRLLKTPKESTPRRIP